MSEQTPRTVVVRIKVQVVCSPSPIQQTPLSPSSVPRADHRPSRLTLIASPAVILEKEDAVVTFLDTGDRAAGLDDDA
jgi:hypothetical protein